MSLYEIVFTGQLVPGADMETVKANLARLFQADAARIAQLFSGRRIVIKNNLDAAAAEKYRSTIERAGALVSVEGGEPEVEEIEMAVPVVAPVPVAAAPINAPAASANSGSGAPRLKVKPRDEYMAAFTDVDAPDFGIADIDSDLADRRPPAAAPQVDFSQFSLAPVGADLEQIKPETPAPAPDVSHIKLV